MLYSLFNHKFWYNLFKQLYLARYDLRRFDKNLWWCDDCGVWIENRKHTKCISSTNVAVFKSKRKAFKEFDKLTERGIDCKLIQRKVIFWHGWYFTAEWYSKDQKFFGSKKLKTRKIK